MTHPTPIPPPAMPGFVAYDEPQPVPAGPTAEQEIRADALTAAARLAAVGKLALSADLEELLDFADDLAVYIRDGSRP